MTPIDRPLTITIAAHVVGFEGGQDRVTAQLAIGLLARGHRVVIVAGKCDLEPHPNLRYIRIPMPGRPASIAFALFYLFASVVLVRRKGLLQTSGAIVFNHIDVATVHFCCRQLHSVIRISRSRRQSWTYRANEAIFGIFTRAAERWSYRPSRIRRLLPVSSGTADEIRHWFPSVGSRIGVIPNGVDAEEFRPDENARKRVRAAIGLGQDQLMAVFLGGDWERKGLRYAIAGIAATSAWHIVVVGEGDRRTFTSIAEKMQAVGRVHFVGKVTDPQRYLAAGDVLLFPSAYEAFPLTVLEAAACGLPLLVTPVSGARDLIVEGVNGWTIERDRDVIAQRLALLVDPKVRQTMGLNARASIGRFNWDTHVNAYVDVYRNILESGHDAFAARPR